MKDATRTRDIPPSGAAAVVVSAVLALIFAIMPLISLAAAPPDNDAARASARLASLRIEIWPEFDRRQAALVILKGELAADSILPGTVSLRIPASSGGPTAVAYSASAEGQLFNLAYEKTTAADFITLRLQAPQRFFHVEFYDPLKALEPERRYTYVWGGDFTVGRLSARLQEPAGASAFSTQPELSAGSAGPDGLRYWSGELGSPAAGKPFPIEIRYAKADPRTTAEILGLKTPDPTPASSPAMSGEFPWWLVIFTVTLAVAATSGVGLTLWWQRRKDASAVPTSGAGFCRKCGAPLGLGDRYCAACGTRVRRK